jgi:5-methylcytosine-specific restriction endonuclease McrA
METPYCEKCKKETGRIVDVTAKGAGAVDHIIPWKSGSTKAEQWELFTDFDNLQTLCRRHHASKTGSGK